MAPRPATRPITRIRETPGDPAVAFRRVLVPLDGSPEAEEILVHLHRFDPAVEEVLLLHVLPRVHAPVGDAVAGRWIPRDAERYLVKLQSNAAWVRARLRVEAGDVVERVLAVQREEGADLVAMVPQAKSAVARFFLGSATKGVLRGTPAPMLVARQGLARTPVRLKRILVPVGGDPAHRAVVEPVRRLALRLRAEVVLLTVGGDPSPSPEPGFRAIDLGKPADVAEAILERIRSEEADLVAMTLDRAKGNDAVSAAVEAVLRHSPAPLLIQPIGKG